VKSGKTVEQIIGPLALLSVLGPVCLAAGLSFHMRRIQLCLLDKVFFWGGLVLTVCFLVIWWPWRRGE